jgi:hypothetical protein
MDPDWSRTAPRGCAAARRALRPGPARRSGCSSARLCARACGEPREALAHAGAGRRPQAEFLLSRLNQLHERIDDVEDLLNLELDQRCGAPRGPAPAGRPGRTAPACSGCRVGSPAGGCCADHRLRSAVAARLGSEDAEQGVTALCRAAGHCGGTLQRALRHQATLTAGALRPDGTSLSRWTW